MLDGFHCLLGADLVPHLAPLTSVTLENSSAWKVSHGIILFGDVQNYKPYERRPLIETE